MFKKLLLTIPALLLLMNCSASTAMLIEDQPLKGINITVDPGHGDTKAYDTFRIGPGGEREEWINLRVAKYLSRKLTLAGANVLMTREKDRDVSLGGRARLAKSHASDLLVSIHHNGSGNDLGMDLPIVYFFGPATQNPASVDFAKILIDRMRSDLTFEQPLAGAVYSDHLIYNSGTSILRNTVNDMPGVIGEGGFFTNTQGEKRLKTRAYNRLEADIYFEAILEYFERGIPKASHVLPDSFLFIDFKQELEFHLDDGFGNAFFDNSTVKIFQDGEPLKSTWDPVAGILKARPLPSEERKVSFQVFGRNLQGNSIHPRPFKYLTERGYNWLTHEKWREAFDEAQQYYTQFEALQVDTTGERINALEASLHLYQLSLELQIVHPEARLAEEQILYLLEKKQALLNTDLSDEIEAQKDRLRDFYPE